MRGVLERLWRAVSRKRRDELERGLDEEIRFHVDQQTEKNLRAGMALEDALRDVRHGARALGRAPGFTSVATLTLALGIGATTAMFSVLNGVVLRPLPYPEQDRLVELVHEAPGIGPVRLLASPAIYFTYRDHARVFDSVGLWDWDRSPVTVSGLGDPEAVSSVELTNEVLAMLGAQPVLGRAFRPEDDLPASPPTAVISYDFWQRRFGGENPIGRMLIVDGTPRSVIGVLPQWFRFFDYRAELYYPLQPDRSSARFPSFDGRGIARLKPGATLAEANADVGRMIPILQAEFGQPGASWERARFGPQLVRLKDTVVGNLGATLWLLMGTVALLLLIACANVANLVLVRSQARRPQLAIRAALGAGWVAIARVVLAESAVLGLVGGAAGVVVAWFALPRLVALGAEDLPQIMAVTIDLRVLLVALFASMFATFLFSLVPAVQLAATRKLTGALHAGGRSGGEGRQGNRTRHALVVSQVALALVLLVGTGLMIRTFRQLLAVDPGFRDPETLLTFQLTIPLPDASDAMAAAAHRERNLRLKHAILDRLSAVGGVESAAFSSFNDGLPLDGDGRGRSVLVEGRPAPAEGTASSSEAQYVSPGFFETSRTQVVAGRAFDWSDVYQDRQVALVSENLARAEWGSPHAALGKRIATNPAGPWRDVGVVKDVHHDGVSRPAPQTVAFPAVASDTASFVVRSERVGTPGLLEDLRQAVWSVDANLSLAGVKTLGDMYRRSMARTTMTLKLLAITGGMALVLGLVGVYGTVSCAVAQRGREIGIRLALGAQRSEVRRMFVKLAISLVAGGVAIGLAASAWLTQLMKAQLFGVSPLDLPTHLAVALALLAAAGLASYMAARRASELDPVQVLKGE